MAKEKNPQYGNKVRTGECFASFPHLDAPDTGKQYSDDKYKVDAIFIDKEAMKPLVDECKRLAKANCGTIPEDFKWPWKSGDEGSVSKFQGYPGRYYITPKTKKEIPVVGADPKIGIDPAKVYGGAIIKVNVTPKYYEMDREGVEVQPDGTRKKIKFKEKGITLYLNGVQFLRDSERFGSEDGGGGSMFDNESGVEEDSDDPLDF